MLKKRLQTNFTTTDNRIMQCDKLTFGARGLYLYMLSLPKDWEFSEAELAKNGGISINKCKGLLKELFDMGLLNRELIDNKGGEA